MEPRQGKSIIKLLHEGFHSCVPNFVKIGPVVFFTLFVHCRFWFSTGKLRLGLSSNSNLFPSRTLLSCVQIFFQIGHVVFSTLCNYCRFWLSTGKLRLRLSVLKFTLLTLQDLPEATCRKIGLLSNTVTMPTSLKYSLFLLTQPREAEMREERSLLALKLNEKWAPMPT